MHKKRSKICIRCRVSEAKFYLYHSTKIANARPRFDEGIFDSYVHLILVVLGQWDKKSNLYVYSEL